MRYVARCLAVVFSALFALVLVWGATYVKNIFVKEFTIVTPKGKFVLKRYMSQEQIEQMIGESFVASPTSLKAYTTCLLEHSGNKYVITFKNKKLDDVKSYKSSDTIPSHQGNGYGRNFGRRGFSF